MTFSAKDVFKIRERAQKADDPMELLAAFTSLQIKSGFTLYASFTPYIYEGHVGYVWAIPVLLSPPKLETSTMVGLRDLSRPFSIENSCLDGLEMYGPATLPRPLGALGNVMEAIEGDGTVLSYLQASIFAREAAEFGAYWHGDVWSTHTILGGDPWTFPHNWRYESEKRPSSEGNWHWLSPKPSEWRPSVIFRGRTIRVRFYTYTGLVQEAIYCYSDTYTFNSYKFSWGIKKIAVGQEEYIF